MRLVKIGALGAVIHGNVRDLAELRSIGLPVFALGSGICSPAGVTYPSQIGTSVRMGQKGPERPRVVHTGDIVVGDENGVALIPRDMETDVVALLQGLVEQDERVRAALEEGKTAEEAFKLRTS